MNNKQTLETLKTNREHCRHRLAQELTALKLNLESAISAAQSDRIVLTKVNTPTPDSLQSVHNLLAQIAILDEVIRGCEPSGAEQLARQIERDRLAKEDA